MSISKRVLSLLLVFLLMTAIVEPASLIEGISGGAAAMEELPDGGVQEAPQAEPTAEPTPVASSEATAVPTPEPAADPAPTKEAPAQAPVFAAGAAYAVQIVGGSDGEAVVVRLEYRSGSGAWKVLPNSGGALLTLALDGSGSVSGRFALVGLPSDDQYRARIERFDAEDGYTIAYSDERAGGDDALTRIMLTSNAPAVEPEDTQEPAGEPTEVPGENEQQTEVPQEDEETGEAPQEGEETGEAPQEGEETGEAPQEGEETGEDPQEGEETGEDPQEGEETGEDPQEGDEPTEVPGEDEQPTEVPQEGEETAEAPETAQEAQTPDLALMMGRGIVSSLNSTATLTLNITLNGMSATIVLSMTGDAGSPYTLDSVSPDTLAASVSGERLTIEPTGAPDLVLTIAQSDGTFSVTSGTDAYQTQGGSGAETIDISAIELFTKAISVSWNDNNDEDDIRPASYPVIVSGGGYSDPVVLTAADEKKPGSWEREVRLPKYDAGGENIEDSYTFAPASFAPGYVVTSQPGSLPIVETLATSLTVYKQWFDASTGEQTRPAQADWLAGLTLMRKSTAPGGGVVQVESFASDINANAAGDLWALSIADLPDYDNAGYPYVYYIREESPVSGDEQLGTYENKVKNVGVYADMTAPNMAYDGGTLTSTIVDTTGFSFQKIWKDDGADESARPNITFYLYRFPMNEGLSFDTLAPVKGRDSMVLSDELGRLEESGESFVFTYVDGKAASALPRYDEKGNEYVYYVREVMTNNNGDYVGEIDNSESIYAGETGYILQGGTVTNVRKAETSAPYTKVWKAKALQAMHSAIQVRLERKLTTQENWEIVDTAELGGFSEESATRGGAFDAQPKYDENGAQYQYRVIEVGATLDEGGDFAPIEQGKFSSEGYDFEVEHLDDSSNTIVNRLVGETQLRLIKRWSPALPEGEEGCIRVQIYQNESADWNVDGVTSSGSAAAPEETGTIFAISGQGDLETLFSGLPKYDEDGREYRYTVSELGDTSPTDYAFDNLAYSVAEDGVRTATITNSSGGEGEGMVFEVEKVWRDDDDLLHRVPIDVGLYYKAPDSDTIVQAAVFDDLLTAAGQWYGRISYAPTGDQTSDPADYFLREISGNGLAIDEDAGYIPTGTGIARTDHHSYTVTTAGNGTNRYTITNLRIGKVEISLTKAWRMQALMDGVTGAEFALYRGAESEPIDRQSLDKDTASIRFGELDKYDETGAMIHYEVRELSLEGSFGDEISTTFANGSITVAGVGTIRSSASAVYTRGQEQLAGGDPDALAYQFTNKLSDSDELKINKVWRDGDDPSARTETRPDIRLYLYRYIDGQTPDTSAGAQQFVTSIRLWNTSILGEDRENDWYWTCNFGTQPKFDDNGNLYHYYVTETILQSSSNYKVSYYSDIDGTADQPNAFGTTAEGTFWVNGDGKEFAYASFEKGATGTIINTLQGTRDITIKKMWLNIPSWFARADLPTVRMKLYRSTSVISADGVDFDNLTGLQTYPLEGGKRSETVKGLPSYDAYGNRYYYCVQELDEDGDPFAVNGYKTNNAYTETAVTNTYNLDAPYVTIDVVKSWIWSMRDGWQTEYPAVTFELYQVYPATAITDLQTAKRNAKVNEVTLPGGVIPAENIKSASHKFTKTSAGANLMRYAPDGTEFAYYVVEKPIAGYSQTLRQDAVFAAADGDGNREGSVSFANAYNPENLGSFLATKVWADQGDAYGTRPAIDAGDITFELWRRTASVDEHVDNSVPNRWIVKPGNPDQWTYTFAGLFAKYSTLGEQYTYYVVETIKEGSAAQRHYLAARNGDLQWTNTLDTVDVKVQKSWIGADGTTTYPLNSAALQKLNDLGAMPQRVTFTGTANWLEEGEAYSFTKLIEWSELLNAAASGAKITIRQNLPKYVPQSTDEAMYTVAETDMTMAGDVKNPSDAGFAVTASPADGSNTVSDIVNTIEVRKLYFVKNWDDENNRDHNRPASIDYKVAQIGDDTPSTTVVLSASTTSSDPLDDEAHKATGANRWRAELIVPKNIAYTTLEVLTTAGYSQSGSATAEDGGQTNWWSFTNAIPREVRTITAQKAWQGDAQWKADTRPQSVSVHLEYRNPRVSNDWISLKDAVAAPDIGMPFDVGATRIIVPDGSGNWINTVSWVGLPVNTPKSAPTHAEIAYQYRIVEDAVIGYTSNSPVAVAPAVTTTVTNTLDTTNLVVKKVWEDNLNHEFDLRPTSIAVKLQRRLAGEDEFADVPAEANLTLSEANSWQDSFADLPQMNVEGRAYTYRAVEIDPSVSYSSTTVLGTSGSDQTATITNSYADKKSLKVTKTWSDFGDTYLSRPTAVTVELEYRIGDGDTPAAWVKSGWKKAISITNSADARDSVVFDNLPAKVSVDGVTREYQYRAAEIAIPAGYADGYSHTAAETLITNTLVPFSMTVAKAWDNKGYADYQPASYSIEVQLWQKKINEGETQWREIENVSALLTNDNGGMAIFADLAEYAPDGVRYQYKVTEETPVPAYRPTYSAPVSAETAASGFTVTNVLQTTSVTGTKTWADNSDLYGARPEGIALTLLADGVPTDKQPAWTNTTTNNWSYNYDNLPKYQNNPQKETEIAYTVTEAPAVGYAPEADGYHFTNTLIATQLSVEKIWNDSVDDFKLRPTSIKVAVQRKPAGMPDTAFEPLLNKTGDAVTADLTGAGGWKHTFTGLPRMYSADTEYAYRAVEMNLPANYTRSESTASGKTTITNTLTADHSLTVTKAWADQGDKYDTRPESIKLQLQSSYDGGATWVDRLSAAVVTKPQSGDWTHTFANLPSKDGKGNDIRYRVVEVGAPVGYTVGGSASADNGWTITNTLETVDLSGSKTWADQSNGYGTRPEGIALTLFADGEKVTNAAPAWVSKGGDVWQYSYANLPKYAKSTGRVIAYSVEEGEVVGYAPATAGYHFTNTLMTTQLSVEKTWPDDAADEFKLHPRSLAIALQRKLATQADDDFEAVRRNDAEATAVSGELTVANGWKTTFTGLPAMNADGEEYIYRAVETDLPENYESSVVTGTDANGQLATITNRFAGYTSMTVTKAWADQGDTYGTRPESIELQLQSSYDGGTNWVDRLPVAVVTRPQSGDWTHTFANLPKTDVKGDDILYRVEEVSAPVGYTVGGNADASNGWKITNTLVTVDISGKKIWEDQSNAYDTRPEGIALTLCEGGSPVDPQPAISWDKTVKDEWTYTYRDLPKYKAGANGEQLLAQYSVVEDQPDGYAVLGVPAAVTIDGDHATAADITNELIVVTVSGAKTWAGDSGGRYGTRPESLALTLYAGATEVTQAVPVWTVTDGNTWSYTYSDLPRYVPGTQTPVIYSVKETAVTGYSASTDQAVEGTVGGDGSVTGVNFTNTLIATQLSVEKIWEDNGDAFGLRPDAITVKLQRKIAGGTFADVSPLTTLELKKEDDWAAVTFTDLPAMNANGEEYLYRAAEMDLPWSYEASEELGADQSGQTSTITNTFVTEKALTVEKRWEDQSDAYDTRPGSILVELQYRIGGEGEWMPSLWKVMRRDSEGTWNSITFDDLPAIDGEDRDRAYEYRVVELSPPADYLPTYQSEGGDWTITNTLVTVDLSGSKTWSDQSNDYGTRPGGIALTLYADGAKVSQHPQPTAWEKPEGSDTWTYIYRGLPRYKPGTGTPIVYSVEETMAAGYRAEGETTAFGEVNPQNGDVTEANFVNELIVVTVSGAKTWAGDSGGRYGTRPESLALTLYAGATEVTQAAPVWTVTDENTWSYTYSDLPRYVPGTQTPVIYSVKETAVTGYSASTEQAVEGTVGGDGSVTGANFTNTLIATQLSVEKIWEDNGDAFGLRPDAITVKLQRKIAGGEFADVSPLTTLQVKEEDGWASAFTGLPAMNADGQEYLYRAAETDLPASYALVSEPTAEGKTTITNAFADARTVVVSKVWNDEDGLYGTRPAQIEVELEYRVGQSQTWNKANPPLTAVLERQQDGSWSEATFNELPSADANGGVYAYRAVELSATDAYTSTAGEEVDGEAAITNELASMTELQVRKVWDDASDANELRPQSVAVQLQQTSDGGENWKALKTLVLVENSSDIWEGAFSGLPTQTFDGTPLSYRAVELTTMREYTTSTEVDGDGVTVITNALVTVSIDGTKTWTDETDRYDTRPEELQLTLLADNVPVQDPPAPTWTKSGNTWTYRYEGLSRYSVDGEIVYTVREGAVAQYQPTAVTGGVVDQQSGDVSQADFENRLIRRLEIDNTTVNPATAHSDAGGFVAIAASPDRRDIDPYQDDQVEVRWRPDEYWRNETTFTVEYLEHGPDAQWRQVTVPIDDLSALRAIPYFANASLEISDGVVALKLAGSAEQMPYQTRVLVHFQPTLLVENTTKKDRGGEVKISQWSNVLNGRDPAVTVYGRAKSGYRVDMDNLQISMPQGVSGSAAENSGAVRIKPNAKGYFSAAIVVEIAGVPQTITVTGRVKVLKRDANGDPTEVQITLDDLPVSLDVGIPFVVADEDVPATGDPILWAVALLLLSGLALLLLRRKRGK